MARLSEELRVSHYDFDPGDTAADDIAWIDCADVHELLVTFYRPDNGGTSALTFLILGNTAADGSGTDTTIATYSGSQPDAAGDYAVLEVNASDIANAGNDIRGISASCAVGTGTDEGVVTYVIRPRTAEADNTASSIA